MGEAIYQCPFCGGEFSLDTEWRGVCRCPHCRQSVTIDAPRPRVAPPQPGPLRQPQPVEDCREEDGGDTAPDDILIPFYRLISAACFVFAIFDWATPIHGCNATGAYAGPFYFFMIGIRRIGADDADPRGT